MLNVVIVDYDSGNIHSAHKAIYGLSQELGNRDVRVSDDPDIVAKADYLILPGDGAFGACRHALHSINGLTEAITDAVQARAIPFLGICVGMQMLGQDSDEFQLTPGFGWIDGNVRKIKPNEGQKVPHMGWNALNMDQGHPALGDAYHGCDVYFVHSFAMQMQNAKHLIAHCEYGQEIPAIVGRDNILGFQFHPEKSQEAGLNLLLSFLRWRG